MNVQTLRDVLLQQGNQQAHHLALIAPETGHSLDYGGLAAFASQLEKLFELHGVEVGDHVALVMPNGLTASALFLATMATGRVVAPLSLLAQRSQLEYVLNHCEAKLVFCTDSHSALVTEILGDERAEQIIEVDPDRVSRGALGGANPFAGTGIASAADTELRPDSIALLMYTSGTTGTPKGVPLSHANLLAAAKSVAKWHGLGPHDRVLSALPLYHINAQVVATITPFVSGGSLVAPRKFSVSGWWAAAQQYKCTWLNLVPTIIAYLLNDAENAPQSIPGIRFARSASAPLPPEHHRAFESRFCIPVVEAMGMTECSSVVFCNPMDLERRKIGSPGMPLLVEARVVGKYDVTVDIGTIGEIQLRGTNVMTAYFKSPEQTANTFTQDGWLRSGDLGFRDIDGFFFVTGRLKELIIKGGENIAPREIDEALLGHPAILEAAAVGVPHPEYGQDIMAAVVLKEGAQLDETQLRIFCEKNLGHFKTPTEFRFVDALPKGASGKVQRLKLLDT